MNKTQQILAFCKRGKTSAQVRDKFGYSKTLIATLIAAGCMTSTRLPREGSVTSLALYKATGTPYLPGKRGPAVVDMTPGAVLRRETHQAWAKTREEYMIAYRAWYRQENKDRINKYMQEWRAKQKAKL